MPDIGKGNRNKPMGCAAGKTRPRDAAIGRTQNDSRLSHSDPIILTDETQTVEIVLCSAGLDRPGCPSVGGADNRAVFPHGCRGMYIRLRNSIEIATSRQGVLPVPARLRICLRSGECDNDTRAHHTCLFHIAPRHQVEHGWFGPSRTQCVDGYEGDTRRHIDLDV